jgi:hypothetical protein
MVEPGHRGAEQQAREGPASHGEDKRREVRSSGREAAPKINKGGIRLPLAAETDSPLEEAGFELSVPRDATKVSRPNRVHYHG